MAERWKDAGSLSMVVLEKLVKDNQRLLCYNVYLSNFIIFPNNTQSHTRRCSLPELCPVIISVSGGSRFEGTQGREGLQRPPLKCRFKQ